MGETEDRRNSSLQRAVEIYKARRERAKLFDSNGGLFGEPAWDILLDLYIAHERGQPICLTDATLGAGVPVSTAQRWVRQLLARGLLYRQDDARDARRIRVSLSEKTLEIMRLYFDKYDAGTGIEDATAPISNVQRYLG